MKPVSKLIFAGVLVVTAAACSATPADYSYVTDYQIAGDRTVKYIYLPGEESEAGGAYLDQGVALEICSVESPGDGDGSQRRGSRESSSQTEPAEETNCRTTRILKTEEYR